MAGDLQRRHVCFKHPNGLGYFLAGWKSSRDWPVLFKNRFLFPRIQKRNTLDSKTEKEYSRTSINKLLVTRRKGYLAITDPPGPQLSTYFRWLMTTTSRDAIQSRRNVGCVPFRRRAALIKARLQIPKAKLRPYAGREAKQPCRTEEAANVPDAGSSPSNPSRKFLIREC